MALDTRSRLIDSATALVRRRGYTGVSYADLAQAVGVRKASIHHHFPAKEDLGLALVAGYTAAFSHRLAEIDGRRGDAWRRLRAYADIHREALQAGEGCPCGVMAAEIAALPPRLQLALGRFFQLNLVWLKRTFAVGAPRLRPDLEPDRAAHALLSNVQGATLMALALGDVAAFDQALGGALAALRVPDA